MKKDRIGEINYNKSKSKMTIIEYEGAKNILVSFENGYCIKCAYSEFKKGEVKNPYDKTVYNIGCFGEGDYKGYINNKRTLQYQTWITMLQRCYDDKYQIKEPTYKGCTVHKEWHNYQNFAKWFDENYYEIEEEVMCLDKDILHKGNKVYSPDNCIFVPNNINILFVKNNAKRGNFPIGVTFDKNNNNYQSRCKNRGKYKYLGNYDTPEKAFQVYKIYKEKHIKEIADEYKNKYSQFPKKLYQAMYDYIVDITD